MKPLLPIFFWLWPCLAIAQAKEVSSIAKSDTARGGSKQQILKPEILTSGFIDIVNNGKVNASARFVPLFISELRKLICLAPRKKRLKNVFFPWCCQ